MGAVPEKTQLAIAFLKTQPGAAAQILERQDPAAVAKFLAGVPSVRSAPVLSRMLPRYSARLCESVTAEQSAALLSALSSSVVAAILRHTRPETMKQVLPHLSEKNRLTLRIVLNYSAESVGAWMIPNNLVLPRDCTIQEALERVAADPGEGGHELIPVVDREGQLQGEVTMRALIGASAEVTVGSVMRESLNRLRSRAQLDSVANHRGWQSHAALPVVSRDGKLVGVLRHFDLQRGLAAAAATPEPTTDAGMLGQIFRTYALSFVALTNTLFATDKR